ncbi:MAG: hypothetical protein HGA87_00970 [Desulfobulbaceae bacterium]|nr:hypothetical protein [Desulfobulbaceae bacterium]
MVSTERNLRGLVLTAFELKQMTSWPDALIEDYLNILDNLILLASTIDAYKHSDLLDVLQADDTSASTDLQKHVTDAQLKKYEDHRLTIGNPHSTDHDELLNILGTGDRHITANENAEITALDGLASGMVAKTSNATYAARTITVSDGGAVITNGDGVAGNPTINVAVSPVSKSASYSANIGEFIECDCTGGVITITPPAGVSGKEFYVSKIDASANKVTVTGLGDILFQYTTIRFIYSTAWRAA